MLHRIYLAIQRLFSPSTQGPAPWKLADFEVPPQADKVRFHDFPLEDTVMRGIAAQNFCYCTPIQAQVLRISLQGLDVMGQAQTGTGKTAAFIITLLSHLLKQGQGKQDRAGMPRALILAPTRELVMQIAKDFKRLAKYCNIRVVAVYGGMDYQKQLAELEFEVDVVVATPGRLLDFMRRGKVLLGKVEILVIDEADRMMDMGFIPDMRQIIRQTPHPSKRQTLLFSATFSDEMEVLAAQWTSNAIKVAITPDKPVVDTVEQIVYIVTTELKYTLLFNLITQRQLARVMVFANRRDEVRSLVDKLKRQGISCGLISGDVMQEKRVKTLERFRAGKIKVLVATDVAGRGIHIEGVSHVINFTLPQDPEDYVHRIGRTGRAGEKGTSISFACEDDSFQIPEIEAFIGQVLPCSQPEEELLLKPKFG